MQDLQNRTVNQVHITQVAAQKYPLYRPEAHTSYGVRKVAQKPREPLESDADAMFRLDDFTDDCEPFFESEEDDLSSGEIIFPLLCGTHVDHWSFRLKDMFNPFTSDSAKSKIDKFSEITNWLNCLSANCRTLGIHPCDEKLEKFVSPKVYF